MISFLNPLMREYGAFFIVSLNRQDAKDIRSWMKEKGYDEKVVQNKIKRLLLEEIAR